MSYLVLARKYRPRVFADMIGQEAVAGVLQGAIKDGRVGHAYLFSGPRGTGKTTTARILAKALNCEQGPTPAPCGTCERCIACDAGTEIDVIEIDAASNNGVDDVRALRDQVAYAPADARFKIYIVDEVHMMSKQAFNALLKTLEEPPPHVKFFFATTELHKVPDTILSRCQILRLSPIKQEHIAKRLAYVFEAEGIAAGEGVVAEIARRARGGMRDALSLADQLIALGGDAPTLADLERTSGTGSRDALALLEHVANGERGPALVAVARQTGREGELVDSLLATLRSAAVAHWCGADSPLVEADGHELGAFAERLGPTRLEYWLSELLRAKDRMRLAPGLEGVVLESALLELARTDEPADFAELLERLAKLEQRLGVPTAAPMTKDEVVPAPRAARAAAAANPPATPAPAAPAQATPVAPPKKAANESRAPKVAAPNAKAEAVRGVADTAKAWSSALDDLAKQRPALALVLRRGRCARVGAGLVVTLDGYGDDDRRLCEDARNRTLASAAIARAFGETLELEVKGPSAPPPPPPDDAYTREVVDLFGGRIEDARS